ncbi:MAG: hypothetical protein HYV52_00650 [Parcubacteria group bacterium]|nr:hypothetical protein [Parcubacteria group bacterium]
MEFSYLDEFNKEFKQLLKKYRTLQEDFDLFKERVLTYRENGTGKFLFWRPPGIVRISNLGIETEVYKVKHFSCKTLKGRGSRSGIRIIYAYFPDNTKVEFVEIYFKERDDTDCDKDRIKRYYK